MHAPTLSSQERVAEIMVSSLERIAASRERTMQAVLTALLFTGYRRRSDSSRRTWSKSRDASPPRREA